MRISLNVKLAIRGVVRRRRRTDFRAGEKREYVFIPLHTHPILWIRSHEHGRTREVNTSRNRRQSAIRGRRDEEGLQSGYTICEFTIRLRAGRITGLQLREWIRSGTNRKWYFREKCRESESERNSLGTHRCDVAQFAYPTFFLAKLFRNVEKSTFKSIWSISIHSKTSKVVGFLQEIKDKDLNIEILQSSTL